MKQKALYILLSAEALLCLVVFGSPMAALGLVTSLAAFPFEIVGIGLRALSLSGSAGNVCAIALYSLFCLLPVFLLLYRGKRASKEDALLVVLSALLFYVMYMMINPQLMGSLLSLGDGSIGKAILGGLVWSVAVCYIVLRLLRFWSNADKPQLKKSLAPLLILCAVIFVYAAFGSCWSVLMNHLQTLKESNTALTKSQLFPSRVFLVLQYIVSALPYVLDVFIVFRTLTLLKEMAEQPYSHSCVGCAQALAGLCVRSLAATVISIAALNLLQLIFADSIRSINGTLSIPVISMAFAVAALLFARLIGDNKELQDENDLMI